MLNRKANDQTTKLVASSRRINMRLELPTRRTVHVELIQFCPYAALIVPKTGQKELGHDVDDAGLVRTEIAKELGCIELGSFAVGLVDHILLATPERCWRASFEQRVEGYSAFVVGRKIKDLPIPCGSEADLDRANCWGARSRRSSIDVLAFDIHSATACERSDVDLFDDGTADVFHVLGLCIESSAVSCGWQVLVTSGYLTIEEAFGTKE